MWADGENGEYQSDVSSDPGGPHCNLTSQASLDGVLAIDSQEWLTEVTWAMHHQTELGRTEEHILSFNL